MKEFYEQIFVPWLRQMSPDTDIRIERMIPDNPTTSGRVEGSVTYQGQRYRAIDIVLMEYVADPTVALQYGCPQPWYSFAFIGSIMASSQEMPALEPVATRIFSTFRPTPRWGAEIVQAIVNGMQTRAAMNEGTQRRIAEMETKQRISEMQSSRRLNQGWVDTMGGNYRYKDPKDPRYEGTIPLRQVPARRTPLWRCGFGHSPIASETKPGPGCEQIQ